MGLKAAELGANAVVGYQQAFDLEGEAGVVARAIGKFYTHRVVGIGEVSSSKTLEAQHLMSSICLRLLLERQVKNRW